MMRDGGRLKKWGTVSDGLYGYWEKA